MEITQQTLITEKQIIAPLELVLNEVTPKAEQKDNTQSIKKSLENLFPEQQYDDKDVQRAKEILGPLVTKFTNSELRDVVAETQFLISSWLDDFEKEIFNGLTLNELLHEKGGL